MAPISGINWNRRIIRRILKNQEDLRMELEWFGLLSEREQFEAAIRFGNAKKGALQVWKILVTENLPIIFSLAALLTAIFK